MTTQRKEQAESLDVFVGRRVHLLMWDSKVTQTALGRAIGMDQSSIGKRLRGERGWALDELRAVADQLGTSVAYLVGETDQVKCTPPDLNREPTD